MNRRKTATIVFIVLCVVLVAAAVSLNIGWILVNGRQVLPLVLGIISFSLIIAGIIVYTVFLVREIRLNDQHDAFINSVTHELKTPIASIRLYLDTLQTREVSEGQRREFYRIMLADAERLQRTVEQVLKAGIAGQRRALLHRGPVDVRALAREAMEIARVRHHLGTDVFSFVETDPASELIVEGDADELKTAMLNLLDNAIKYSPREVVVSVEVTPAAANTVYVRVRDQGVGIPAAQIKRIFRRFHRLPVRGFKVKGTGLGLYIVRSIARQHGGRVFAHSEGEGTGATFTLELPRSKAPHASEGTTHLAYTAAEAPTRGDRV